MSELNVTQHDGGFANPMQPFGSDEVLRLTWAVIDGVASDDERRRLGELVSSEYRARHEYLKAVQLDSDLATMLDPKTTPRHAAPRSGQIPQLRTPPLNLMALTTSGLAATG